MVCLQCLGRLNTTLHSLLRPWSLQADSSRLCGGIRSVPVHFRPVAAASRTFASAGRHASGPRRLSDVLKSEEKSHTDIKKDPVQDFDLSGNTPRPSRRPSPRPEHEESEVEVSKAVSADAFAALGGSALRAPKLSRKELRRQKSLQACKDLAFFLLSRRMHSRHELHTKLTRKERFDPDVIQEALNRLQELDSINDAEFARQYALSKSQYSVWAPSRIKMGLRILGVNDVDIQTGLDALAEADIDIDSSTAGSLLLEAAAVHLRTLSNASSEAQQRRMVGWLQRRGYSWEVTASVLNHLKLRQGT